MIFDRAGVAVPFAAEPPSNSTANTTATLLDQTYEQMDCYSLHRVHLRVWLSLQRTLALAVTKLHNSSSRCGNPQQTKTQDQWHPNRSPRRSIANQRQVRSNWRRNGHRRSLRRPWRARSDLMREGIARDARGHSLPPRQCTICNDHKRVADRSSWLVQNKILRKRGDRQNQPLLRVSIARMHAEVMRIHGDLQGERLLWRLCSS